MKPSAQNPVHEIFLYRRDGLDFYACTCGARAKVSSTSDQTNRAGILKSFASEHLNQVRFASRPVMQ